MTASSPPVRIVFLDIDGVLQPTASQKRFDHDLVALREDLAERFLDESAALRARQILAGGPVTQENRHYKPLVFGPYRHLSG